MTNMRIVAAMVLVSMLWAAESHAQWYVRSMNGGVFSQTDLEAVGDYTGRVTGQPLTDPAPTIRQLLENTVPANYQARQAGVYRFSADEVLDETVSSEADLSSKYERIASKFSQARATALNNTRHYLSMLSDLDVYVATSMRTTPRTSGAWPIPATAFLLISDLLP